MERGWHAGLRVTCPAPRSVWTEVLAADPGAMPSQTPAWLDAVCRTDGWSDASRLYEVGSDRPLVLPMVARLQGRWAVRASMPRGWEAGGVLAPGGVRPDEVAAVLDDLGGDGALRTFVRPGFAQAPAWDAAWADRRRSRRPGGGMAVAVPRRVHVLDVSGGIGEVWEHQLTAEARKGIRRARRRAEQAGVVVKWGNGPELLRGSEEVHRGWVERRAAERMVPRRVARLRAARAEPPRRAVALAAALGDAMQIGVASVRGVPVATQVALFEGAVAVMWRSYADLDAARTLRVNELVLYEAIELSCRRGCSVLELGESGGVASLERFKQRLGAVPWPFAEYALERLPLTRSAAGAERILGRAERRVLDWRAAAGAAAAGHRPPVSPRGTKDPTADGGRRAP